MDSFGSSCLDPVPVELHLSTYFTKMSDTTGVVAEKFF
jgi:hypothetical protein